MLDICLLKMEIEKHLNVPTSFFEQMMSMKGEVFRELEGRRTQRIYLNQQAYFIKQHFGVGWREIFKNLLS